MIHLHNSRSRVRNAVKIKYQGIEFKSKLELFTYRKLKEEGIRFKYEKDIIILQPDFVNPSTTVESKLVKDRKTKVKTKQLVIKKDNKIQPISYKPDFVDSRKNWKWLIECKGIQTEKSVLKWKMFKYHLFTQNKTVTLYMPSNQKEVLECIELIKKSQENV